MISSNFRGKFRNMESGIRKNIARKWLSSAKINTLPTIEPNAIKI